MTKNNSTSAIATPEDNQTAPPFIKRDYVDPITGNVQARSKDNGFTKTQGALNDIATGLDTFNTPVRLLQIFGSPIFQAILGTAHFTGDLVCAGLSFVNTIPYFLKTYYQKKHETKTLAGLLKNLEKDIGYKLSLEIETNRKNLADYFNKVLRKQNLGYLFEACIELNKKNEYDLIFHYKKGSTYKNIFVDSWDYYKDLTLPVLTKEIFSDFLSGTRAEIVAEEQLVANTNNKCIKLKAQLKHAYLRFIELKHRTLDDHNTFIEKLEELKQEINQDSEFYKNNMKFCDAIFAYSVIHPAFYDNEIFNFSNETLEKRRLKALEALNKLSKVDVLTQSINHFGMGIWLVFASPNFCLNQDDTTVWAMALQAALISGAFGYMTVQTSLEAANHHYNKFTPNDLREGVPETSAGSTQVSNDAVPSQQDAGQDQAISENKTKPSTDKETPGPDLVFETLKQQGLQKLFIELVYEDNYKKVDKALQDEKALKAQVTPGQNFPYEVRELIYSLSPKQDEFISKEILKTVSKKQQKRIHNKLASQKIENQFELLEKDAQTEFRKQNSLKRVFNVAFNMADNGIKSAFFAWSLSIILIAVGATIIGGGIGGPIAAVIFFGAGMIFGAYRAYAQYKQHKIQEHKLKHDLQENKDKVEWLIHLKNINALLESKIILSGKEPIIGNKAHQYKNHKQFRVAGSLAAKKSNKRIDRGLDGLDKADAAIQKSGTGALIMRLTIIPIICVAAGLSFAVGPVGLGIILAAGVIWAGIHIYAQHNKAKVEAANYTNDNIDDIIVEQQNNREILAKQLGYNGSLPTFDEFKAAKERGDTTIEVEVKVEEQTQTPEETCVSTKPVTSKTYKERLELSNKAKVITLVKELTKARASYKPHEDLSAIRGKIAKEYSELADLKGKLAIPLEQSKELNQSLKNVQHLISVKSAKLMNEEQQLTSIKNEEPTHLEDINKNLVDCSENTDKEIEILKTKNAALDAKAVTIEASIKDLNNEAEILKESIKALNDEVGTLEKSIKALEAEIITLSNTISSKEQLITELEKTIKAKDDYESIIFKICNLGKDFDSALLKGLADQFSSEEDKESAELMLTLLTTEPSESDGENIKPGPG